VRGIVVAASATCCACLSAPAGDANEDAGGAVADARRAGGADGATSGVDAGRSAPLLHLPFEGTLVSTNDVSPTEAGGIAYVDGVDGSAAYIDEPDVLRYAPHRLELAAGTIEMWVKPSWDGDDGLNHHFVTWGEYGGLVLLKDGGNTLKIIFNRQRPASGSSPETGALYPASGWAAGEWHHIAATWGEEIRLYVDGVHRDTGTMEETIPITDDITIGDDFGTFAGARHADAALDDLRFHAVALTEAEIEASYSAAAP
jgi:hypothetical protein